LRLHRIERRRQTGASTGGWAEGRAAQLLEEGECLHDVGMPRSAARAGDGGMLKVQRRGDRLAGTHVDVALETIIGGVGERGVSHIAWFRGEEAVVTKTLWETRLPKEWK
jgi:hypothetical protein